MQSLCFNVCRAALGESTTSRSILTGPGGLDSLLRASTESGVFLWGITRCTQSNNTAWKHYKRLTLLPCLSSPTLRSPTKPQYALLLTCTALITLTLPLSFSDVQRNRYPRERALRPAELQLHQRVSIVYVPLVRDNMLSPPIAARASLASASAERLHRSESFAVLLMYCECMLL